MKNGMHGADGTQQIRGVETNVKGREPRQRDHNVQMPGSHTEMIQEGKYGDGQTRHGTNPANIHTSASARHYLHPDSMAHRRSLGSQPHPDAKFGKR